MDLSAWIPHLPPPPQKLIHVCIPDISLLNIIIKIRKSRYGNRLFQVIYFGPFFPHVQMDRRGKSRWEGSWTRSQKRKAKTKVRQLLLTHTLIFCHFTGFSPSASLCLELFLSRLSPSPLPPSTQPVRHRGPVCGLHPSGRWTGRLQKQFLFTGLQQFIFSFSGATPCKGTGSEDQPLCCAKQTLHIWQEEQKT